MTTDAGRLAALDDLEAALASPAHAAEALASLLSEPRKDALLARLRLSVVTDLAERLIAELPARRGPAAASRAPHGLGPARSPAPAGHPDASGGGRPSGLDAPHPRPAGALALHGGAALSPAGGRVRHARAVRDPLPHGEPHADLAPDGRARGRAGPRPAGHGRRRRARDHRHPLREPHRGRAVRPGLPDRGPAQRADPRHLHGGRRRLHARALRRAHGAGVGGRAGAQGAGAPRGPSRPGPHRGARCRLRRGGRSALAGRPGGTRGGRAVRRAGAAARWPPASATWPPSCTPRARPERPRGSASATATSCSSASRGPWPFPRSASRTCSCATCRSTTPSAASSSCSAASSGAPTYCFLDIPSVEALVAGMRRFRPTVVHQRAQEVDAAARGDRGPAGAAGLRRRRGADGRRAARHRRPPALGPVGRRPPRLRGVPLLPAPRHRAAERLRHDRGHGRHHHDAARRATGTTRWAARSPASSCAWSEDGELLVRGPVRDGWATSEPSGGERGARRRGLVPHRRPHGAGRGRLPPPGRPQEGDLQEHQGRDDRAPAGREPLPRLRLGRRACSWSATIASTTRR